MKRVSSIAALGEYLGEAAAAAMVRSFGGQAIKIPLRRSGRTWGAIVAAVGAEAAEELCRNFGGEVVYVPRLAADEVAERHRAVLQALAAGQSPRDIARSMTFTARYSERAVRRIAALYCGGALLRESKGETRLAAAARHERGHAERALDACDDGPWPRSRR